MADEREREFPRELREYIEAERKASFAAGYAEAKREAFAASFAVPLKSDKSVTAPAPKVHQASAELIGRGSLSVDSQMARGMPELYIEEEYRAIAPRTARAIDIRLRIKEAHGVDIPASTLHRTIRRLAERGVLEKIGNTSAWRYVKRREGESGSLDDDSKGTDSGILSSSQGNGAAPRHP
jgi:hypothetical protein